MTFTSLRKRGYLCIDLSPSPERSTFASSEEDRTGKVSTACLKSSPKRAKQSQQSGDPVLSIESLQAILGAGQTEHGDATKRDPTNMRSHVRNLVHAKLAGALGTDPLHAHLATEVEEALHQQLGDGKAYSAQARAILFNLKDNENGSLKRKLFDGRIDAKLLPKMHADEMLSDAKSSQKAKVQKAAAEASTVKGDVQVETDMFTCESCGSTKTKYSTTAEMRTYGAQQKMVSVSHVTCLACGQSWVTR